jgi:hypothetical protein
MMTCRSDVTPQVTEVECKDVTAPIQTTILTERERIVLEYLSPLMEANARMIGEHILGVEPYAGNCTFEVGTSICWRLRKRDLVSFVSDLKAWRITARGREVLMSQQYKTTASDQFSMRDPRRAGFKAAILMRLRDRLKSDGETGQPGYLTWRKHKHRADLLEELIADFERLSE